MSPAVTPLWCGRVGLRPYLRVKAVIAQRAAQTAQTSAQQTGGLGGVFLQQVRRYYPPMHGEMNVAPSRWSFEVTKDKFVLWLTICGLPVGALLLYCNMFIGNAQLQPVPEDYVPQEHEYYRHPFSRFFAKYFKISHQEQYERHIHNWWETQKKRKQFFLRKEVWRLMNEDGDYKGYYYQPYSGRYLRRTVAIKKSDNLAAGKDPDTWG